MDIIAANTPSDHLLLAHLPLMNQPSESPSNRKGRLLLGALGLSLTFGGISSKINNDLTTENNSLERNVHAKAATIAEKTAEIGKLSGERETLTAQTKQLNQG